MATIRKLVPALGDASGLLKAIGAVVVADIERNFDDQSFGGRKWLERYPNQAPPKINVAGVVADLNAGKNPPKRRFEDRPVLRDTGELRRSINFRVLGQDTVEAGVYGPAFAYANLHQLGGVSRQPITEQAKKKLSKLLRGPRTRKGASRTPGKLWAYRDKLGPLFRVGTLETKLVKRQFVGSTDRLRKAVVDAIELYFEDL